MLAERATNVPRSHNDELVDAVRAAMCHLEWLQQAFPLTQGGFYRQDAIAKGRAVLAKVDAK